MNKILDDSQPYTREVTRDFFKNVYSFMFAALMISGLVAYYAGTPEFFAKYFINVDPITGATSMSPLIYVVMFAPLGLGLLIQMGYRMLSYCVLLALFLFYSVLMGLCLSGVMLVYS